MTNEELINWLNEYDLTAPICINVNNSPVEISDIDDLTEDFGYILLETPTTSAPKLTADIIRPNGFDDICGNCHTRIRTAAPDDNFCAYCGAEFVSYHGNPL